MDAELLYSYLGIAKSIVYIWNFPIPNGRGDHSNEPRENGPSKASFLSNCSIKLSCMKYRLDIMMQFPEKPSVFLLYFCITQ